MKVVIATDSLKGSLTSLEAGDAIRAGIYKADPQAQIIVRPLADGGEGTLEAMDPAISRQNMTDTAEQVFRLFLAARH